METGKIFLSKGKMNTMIGRKSHKVIVKDKSLNIIREFRSSAEAAENLGITANTVRYLTKKNIYNKKLGLWFFDGGTNDTTLTSKESFDFVSKHNNMSLRKCLRCDEMFDSCNFGNRICGNCHNQIESERHVNRGAKVSVSCGRLTKRFNT